MLFIFDQWDRTTDVAAARSAADVYKRQALGCIILILLTTSVGQPIVLYVSALGNVDQSIVEAAEVDGANDFQCFWKIKWPAIMPVSYTHLDVYKRQYVSRGNDGIAAALATILSLTTVVSLLLFMKLSKSKDVTL